MNTFMYVLVYDQAGFHSHIGIHTEYNVHVQKTGVWNDSENFEIHPVLLLYYVENDIAYIVEFGHSKNKSCENFKISSIHPYSIVKYTLRDGK